jgi:hypothetical protein
VLRGQILLDVHNKSSMAHCSLNFLGLSKSQAHFGERCPYVALNSVLTTEGACKTNKIINRTWTLYPENGLGNGCSLKLDGHPPVNGDVRETRHCQLRKGSLSLRNIKRCLSNATTVLNNKFAVVGPRVVYPGRYVQNFELTVGSRLPETICLERASVSYRLQVRVKPTSIFGHSVVHCKEVPLVSSPDDTIRLWIMWSQSTFQNGGEIRYHVTSLSVAEQHH